MTSSLLRAESSLARTTSETLRPSRSQIASIAAEVVKGKGAGVAWAWEAEAVARAWIDGAPGAPTSSMTKPPPTE